MCLSEWIYVHIYRQKSEESIGFSRSFDSSDPYHVGGGN